MTRALGHPTTFFSSIPNFWNCRAEEGGNMGYKVPIKGGFPVSPADKYADVRDEMSLLEQVG